MQVASSARSRGRSAPSASRRASRPRSACTGSPASNLAAAASPTTSAGFRARIRIAAARAASRFGPAPTRAPAVGSSARRARARTASGPPHSARSGSAAKNASPGREGSTAAPIVSRLRSERSQIASARTGSGAISPSEGQRARASPIRIPARIP